MNQSVLLKILLLFFVFIFVFCTSFLGIQWFSNNLGNFFQPNISIKKDVLSASLEAAALDSIQIADPPAIEKTTENQPIVQQNLPVQPANQDKQNIDNNLNIDAQSEMAIEVDASLPPQFFVAKNWDSNVKILFNRDSKKKLPIASLTKLMTALVVLENYDLNQKVVISQAAMEQEGEQGNLLAWETLSVKNLLYITLIESSNRAAYALSEVMGNDKFIASMNEEAQKMGLLNTHFNDSTGLDPKSYSTAEDLAKLSQYLFLNYPLFKEITGLKEFDLYLDGNVFHHKLISTNKLLGEVPGVVSGKTGWTDTAKGCFMVIQESPKKGNYLIYVVLGAEDRFGEMKKLIDRVNDLRITN